MTQSTRVGSPGSQFNGLGWEHGGEGGMVLKRMIQLGTAAALITYFARQVHSYSRQLIISNDQRWNLPSGYRSILKQDLKNINFI